MSSPLTNCSKNATLTINESWEESQRCVNASFEDPLKVEGANENYILAQNADQWKEYGTLYWPSVTINRVTYQG